MSHEFESGFFTREGAWHGLGTVVENAPTVQEAIRIAELDWTVDEYPILADLGVRTLAIDEKKAMIRSTDGRVLGVVGKNYQPLQNVDAFSFFNPFLHEGDAELESAGSLKEGRRIWVLARIKDAVADVAKGDAVKAFLLLYNSHDGTTAVGVQFTSVRVVCNNTLSAAMREGEKGNEKCLKVWHTKNLAGGVQAVQNAIELSKQTFEFSLEAYREIQRKALPVDGLRQYVRNVFEVPEAEDRMPRAWEHIERLHEGGAGSDIPGVRGTYWGAYNAVTEWIDHERGSDDNRLMSSWWGQGAKIRDRALEIALEA